MLSPDELRFQRNIIIFLIITRTCSQRQHHLNRVFNCHVYKHTI